MRSKFRKSNHLQSTWVLLLGDFWFIRGVLAAITVIAATPTYVDLSQYKFLSFTPIFVSIWRDIRELMSEVVHTILFVDLGIGVVTLVIIVFSIGLPNIWYLMKLDRDRYGSDGISVFTKLFYYVHFFVVTPLMCIFYIFMVVTVLFDKSADSDLGLNFAKLQQKAEVVIFFSVFVLFMTIPVLISFKGYRVGILFVFCALLMVEYVVSFQWFS